mgnify:FL=1
MLLLLAGGGSSVWAVNNSLDFDGSNDYVNLPSSNAVTNLAAFTIEAWVYWNGTNTGSIYAEGNSGSNNPMFSIIPRSTDNGGIELVYRDSSATGLVAQPTSGTIPTNVWTHVAVVKASSTNMKVYINGVLTDDLTFTAPSAWTVTDVGIGRRKRAGAGDYFNGEMDEVRIWDIARSASQILANKNIDISSSESGLVAYYKFNESDTTTTLIDSTSGAYNGTLTNMTGNEWTTSGVTMIAAVPTVSSVSSNTAGGSYKAGDVIDIDVVFSEAVTVTGTPQITLETGDTDRVVNYSSGSGGTALTFDYTVQAGDTTSDLDYTSTSALTLNGGTIKSSGGNDATLTLPTVGGSDSLAGNEALVIDTTAPTNQDTVFASAVTKAGGATVTIVSSATASNVVWLAPTGTSSFATGDTMTKATSGTSTSILAPADAGTYYLYVLDASGNVSSQSSAALTVDNTGPTISSTTVAADNPTIDVTFNEAVFNATGGSGALQASDFTISISGGTKTLSSATPSSISISGNVYTLGLDLSGTANGSETITVVPSSSTAIYDGSDNAASTSQSNNTVSLNSEDSSAPTLSSSSPTDGAGSVAVASNIVLTFSEAVDVESGDIVLYKADGTVVETFSLPSAKVTGTGSTTITINPTANLSSSTNYYLQIAATAFDDSASNSYAGITDTTTLNFTTVGSDPTTNKDVTASVKAMSGVAIDAVAMNFNAVEHRVSWLSANVGSNKLSHQGVRFNFANPTVNKLMNTAYVKPSKLDLSNEFVKLIRNNIKDGEAPEATAMTDDTKEGLTSVAYNEFAKVREDTIGKVLNATSSSVMGDWNIWTEGRITVGKTYKTDTSSEQDSQTQNLSLGFDRIIKDNNPDVNPNSSGHIIGVVLGIGKSDADTTNSSTVDADSYSLSAYGVIREEDKALAQAMMGYGHIKVDKTRIDGSDTLTGSHNANQFFTSIKVQKETIGVGSFSLSPYGKIHASRTWYDGYSETGGATALTYGKQTIDSTVLSAGLDVDYLIPIHKGNIRPFMQFEYGADVSGSSTVNMHYNNEITNYQLQLDNKADSNWKFVLGTDMYTKDEWDSSISYERTEAVDAGYSDSLAVKVGLRF